MNNSRPTAAAKKKLMVAAMIKHNGIITSAAFEAGISRDTYYKWLANDEKFKAEIEKIGEIKKDFIEKKFFELVANKNDKAIIFAMKTLLRDRGYIDKQTIELGGKGKIEFSFGDEEENNENE